MDLCAYAYYKPEEKYMPYLYCSIDNKRCVYSKKCMKVERFIPLENEMWKECYKFIMKKRENIPSGSNFVQTYRPNKHGKLILYVVINDSTERIQTELTELNQDYIYVEKIEDKYNISLTPIVKKSDKSAYISYENSVFKTEEEKPTKINNKKRGRKPKNE